MLTAYYSARAEAWLCEVEAERSAERDDELDEWLGDYRWQLEELTRALKGSSDSDELPEDPRARAEVLLVERTSTTSARSELRRRSAERRRWTCE